MSGNESNPENKKDRARAFFDKALVDLRKANYPLAEFYLQAAVKEDPETQEYRDKLEEVRKVLAQEKEAAEQARAAVAAIPDSPPPNLFPPAKPKSVKKPGPKGKKGPSLFGIPLKNLNPRVIYTTLGILLGIAIAYSVYAFMTKQDAHVNIGDIKKIYGIDLKSASMGEGKLQGFITESWNAMPRNEKELKIRQLFLDYRERTGIKTLILWDDNFSAVAQASKSGVSISP